MVLSGNHWLAATSVGSEASLYHGVSGSCMGAICPFHGCHDNSGHLQIKRTYLVWSQCEIWNSVGLAATHHCSDWRASMLGNPGMTARDEQQTGTSGLPMIPHTQKRVPLQKVC